MRYQYIVASGCSQTQNGPGTGGTPPSHDNLKGGCSYIDQGQGIVESPVSWVSHVAQHLKVSSLVNMAAAGHGNQFVAGTIIDLLTRYPYHPRHTLVLFNITFPHRLDIPCDFRHPDRSTSVPWNSTLLPYTYLSMRSRLQRKFHAHQGNEQVKNSSRLAMVNLFNYLENRGFDFRFTLCMDFTRDAILAPVIEKYQQYLVSLEDGIGIREFVVARNLTHDACHPTVEGHKHIADKVIQHL